ncbi:protein phosphatase 1 regulatory subunit 12B isoform X6 [Glossina fuscipes]|uniref:Protein phosphatase 1 regulatory subunit 12B n=1 Tax=Glossina fuscipes TaxID=7396 RepID=A0A9C5ZQ12_9MUSC|nr:protein phosphatase 1 regulatory subunit 12B isoform X6 [Glossina fuscipes]
MTSLDVRNNSAVMKRAEQLKRWEESDTNHQPATPRPERGNRIKFSSGCIFLAACLSGDKDEVLKMLEQGADINTSNVDGLTALHQACIDDNLEMVEFLVEHGADINRQDNEGWTPLHATASCGFVSIARYLVEHGADVAAVNSDGDLAVDLAVDIQHVPMIDFMQKMVAEQQIDCTKARQAEEQQMLSDAKRWLRSDASEVNRPHPKTGATALHVAAAKGYTKVLSLLLAGRANVDAQDNDGWTPLHAAAHWGQKEAAEMLVDAMGDMDVRNYAGQTCIDVADRKMVKFLEELRPNNKRIKRRPSSQIRISDTIESHIDKASAKIIRVEVRPENNKDHANASSSLASASVTTTTTTTTTITGHNLTTNSESEETDSELTDSTESSHSTSLSDNQDNQEDEKSTNEIPAADDETPWRRSNNVPRGRTLNESSSKIQVPDRDVNKTTTTNNSSDTSDIILRRTQSFENDEKKSPPLSPTTTPPTSNALSTTSSIHTTPTTTTTSNAPAIVNTTLIRSALNNQVNHETTNSPQNEKDINVKRSNHQNLKNQHNNIAGVDTIAVDATVKEAKQTTGNIIKNFFKSFVPPVRDEESETQRKAHAKRVRETRRSTQGVTLDEIKSAEELVKKKNSAMNNNNNNNNNNTSSSNFKLEDASSGNSSYPPNNSIIIPSAPAVIAAANLSSTAMSQRRTSGGMNPNISSSANQSIHTIGRPVSAPPNSTITNSSIATLTSASATSSHTEADTSSTGSFMPRRVSASTSTTALVPETCTVSTTTTNSVATTTSGISSANDDRDNDKENDSRSALATQAVIQRRRKPKRRSTGVVHIDMDDLDPERQDDDAEDRESGGESRQPSRSRLAGLTSSITPSASSNSASDEKKANDRSESVDNIDYKALWEAVKMENEKLKQQLKKKDEEITQTRATLERLANATTKNSLSEIEKRERRTMERKLSELEEELKLLQKLKNENERLRAENRALTRVVSKLTTSAQTQLSKQKQ